MLTLVGLKSAIDSLVRHKNLGGRIDDWANLVWAELATAMVGTSGQDTTVVDDLTVQQNATTRAPWITSKGGIYGRYVMNAELPTTLTSATHTYVLTTNTILTASLPNDIMCIRQIYHAQTTGVGFMTGGTGIAQQKYNRASPADIARLQAVQEATATVAKADDGSPIYYAPVGAAFSAGDSTWYAQQYMIFPHPDLASVVLLEYYKAPSTLEADTDTCVYLMKFPDVFTQGVLRYAWLYLGDFNNYILCAREYFDGIRKIAGARKVNSQVAAPMGMNDVDRLAYLGG